MQRVKDIMSSNVEFCTPLDNVYEVAVKMKDLNVGVIPIVEDQKLIGMITDRDLVVRGIAEKHPGSNQVTNVMTDQVISIDTNASLDQAADMMAKHQIRRLPVVENGKLVGIVSLGDISTNLTTADEAGHALSDISETH
ncbi:CBS domain-containing protein [Metabacillus sediminilitoris]|uniref:CBS domain-containing protein n=1 Tax=Metabacillus sediminilitoris TaxID=2567941 RepID=A0A4S4C5N1_9BACI|nr:CBS domain-containing protein [Metabacillus sediminilitoris]QGQ46977.1 CBS domain-containing protein [Metabacillus sediminilitoris]THF83126.1 CBS domain-containing protein [Metabacillus sediminilitoris]